MAENRTSERYSENDEGLRRVEDHNRDQGTGLIDHKNRGKRQV